jgi:UDP-glucose 4-epimerase
MRVLITGAAGFGASGLIRRLLADGAHVTGVDIVGANQNALLKPGELDKVKWLWKSVQDLKPSDISGHDVVVHLAAQADVPMGHSSPLWSCWENVYGACALLEAIKDSSPRPSKVIYAGSGNEFGRPLYVPIDEKHPLTPHNPYSASKAGAELYFWAYRRCYDLPVVVMSNGIVTGPGMRREIFVFKWFKNILRGLPCVLEGGDQTRDITYVTDVVDGWMRTIGADCSRVVGEKFQISYGEEHRIDEILEWCFQVAGTRTPVHLAPHRPGERGQRECFSNVKARTVLGYKPSVDPKESLRLTWEWMQTISAELL